ncbi:MAG TPA: hypothetical protein VMY78_04370 [Solirubrobacteraceae bacterium]|nr:hypothetical protein [Solirubrobacteraceae bacterium]
MAVIAALSDNQNAWVISLVVGFVVLLVVIALLEMLRRAVVSLNGNLWSTWVSGKDVVKHTGTTYLLKNTRMQGEELLDELGHHG